MTRSWTPAEITDAKALWEAGASARAIAERIGKTRNAVISAMRRYSNGTPMSPGFESYNAANKREPKPPRPKREKKRGPLTIREALAAPVSLPPLAENVLSSGGCRFIAGEPRGDESVYCNRPKRPMSSFCPHHHAVCWIPRQPIVEPPEARRPNPNPYPQVPNDPVRWAAE